MGLLDSLLSSAKKQVTNELKKGIRKGIKKGIDGVGNAVRNAACKSERIRFEALPQTLAEFTALPQAALETPFDTAALTVSYRSEKLTFDGSYTLTFHDETGWEIETVKQADNRNHPLLRLTKLEQKK